MVSAFLLLHVHVEEGRLHQTCVPIKSEALSACYTLHGTPPPGIVMIGI